MALDYVTDSMCNRPISVTAGGQCPSRNPRGSGTRPVSVEATFRVTGSASVETSLSVGFPDPISLAVLFQSVFVRVERAESCCSILSVMPVLLAYTGISTAAVQPAVSRRKSPNQSIPRTRFTD